MSKQQTAVEFLVEQLGIKLDGWNNSVIREAKEMEKRQIEEAAKSCNYIGGATDQEAEDYYKSKYGKNENKSD